MQEKELCTDINIFSYLKDIDKILLFTHNADADGVGCEVVARLFTIFSYYSEEDFFKHYDSKKIARYNSDKVLEERLEVTRMGYKNNVQIVDEKIKKHKDEKCLIIVTDISSSYDLVTYLDGIDNPVIYIDHHLIDDKAYKYLCDWKNEDFNRKFYYLIPNTDSLSPFSSDHFLYDRMNEFNIRAFINVSSMDDAKLSATYIFWVLMLTWFPKAFSNLDGICKADGIFKVLSDSDTYEWKKHKIVRKNGIVYGNKYFHTNIPDPFPLIYKYRGYDFLLENLYYIIKSFVCDDSNLTGEARLIELMDTVSIYDNIRKKNYNYWTNSMQKVNADEIGKIGISFSPDADYSMFSAWSFEEDPDLIALFEVYSDSKIISIRVRDDSDFNGAEFMKNYFNGGGHPKAAGGRLSEDMFINWIKTYWEVKEFNAGAKLAEVNELMKINMNELDMI